MARNRICVAIDPEAKASAVVNVTSYRCPATGKTVLVNNALAPYSPFSGRNLKQTSKVIAELPIGEIRAELSHVGDCPTCDGNHYMFARDARNLNGKKIHCVVCSSKFKVRAEDAGDASTIDTDNEKQKNNRTPENKNDGGSDEDKELLASGDDDDNDDNNDDDNNDDTDKDAGEVNRTGEDMSGDDDNDNDDDNNDDDDAVNTDDKSVKAPAAKVTEPGDANPDATVPPGAQNKTTTPPADGTETTDTDVADKHEAGEADDDDDNDNNDNNDDDVVKDDELVSAAAKELVIDCFARAGGLKSKDVVFIPVSPRLGLILSDGNPVITLDAEKAGDNKKLFADPEALTRAVKTILEQEENPQPASFASLGGAPITYVINIPQEIKARIENGIKSVTTGMHEKQATVVDEIRACLSTASLIVNKNVDREVKNPLRDTLLASLKKLNIKDRAANNLLDQAFAEAAEPYMKAVLAKAKDLFDLPLATRNEMARFVERSAYVNATDAAKSTDHSEQFNRDSVPLTTANTPQEEDLQSRALPVAASNPSVDNYRQLLRL